MDKVRYRKAESIVNGHIYLIRNNVNGKGYVGQTRISVLRRFKGHKFEVTRGSKTALHCAIKKYGFDQFSIQEIASCETHLLDDLESHYIDFYGTFAPAGHGYNMTRGGDTAPRMERSKEHSAKISSALKGRKLSVEQRRLISEGLIGRKRKPLSALAKANISNGRKGIKCSEEHKAKMSEQRMGNSYRKGIPHSPEAKAKISATLRKRFVR